MLSPRRLLLVALLMLLASFAYADSQARIVRLSYVEGSVQLAHSGSPFENATLNVPIIEGDQLRAGSDGWAEVEFEDGSTIRLSPGTALIFSELRLLSSGATSTSVDIDQGEAEFKVNRHNDSQFNVTARHKTIVLKHSGRFRVTTLNSEPLEVAVWNGEVGVQDTSSGQEVTVKKKETFALDLLDPNRYDLEKGTEADGLDQWSAQRDEYLSTYAKRGNYANSPYQYGVSDLNYYGQYFEVPGYGAMWQPYGANAGWDPFANGYWNFTPGGYVWVSAYPWGWMPYRFGYWRFVNGYGWLWQPPLAGAWRTWNFCPPVLNAPVGFRPPVPPSILVKGGTATGAAGNTVTPPATRTGPGTVRTFIQSDPPIQPQHTVSVMNKGGNNQMHPGNQVIPGTGTNPATGTNPTTGEIRKIGPHDQPGPSDNSTSAHGPGGTQHTPPTPTRMPPTPAPAVHPQVTVNPPPTRMPPTPAPPVQPPGNPRPQYVPPPAPATHPAPATMPAPVVHSAPAPSSGGASLSHGRPL